MTTTPEKRTLEVQSVDELRDELPNSGVFDMTDCTVEISCPLDSTTEEIERMVHLVESMINVTDVQISGTPAPAHLTTYQVHITNVPFTRATKKDKK